ncbi:MAG: flagellar basal body L-ring protein FlgH [Pseudomonadota bacterium]
MTTRAPIGLPDRGRRSAGGAAARSEEGAYPSVCDRRATQRMRLRHESADGRQTDRCSRPDANQAPKISLGSCFSARACACACARARARARKRCALLCAALVALSLAGGCTQHIAPGRPKQRTIDPGKYSRRSLTSDGSIYAPGVSGLFEDAKARTIGDIVVIRIDEFESAQRDSSTRLNRASATKAGVANSLGLLPSLPQGVSASALLGADSSNSFEGAGKVAREGRLIATLPVRVKNVMPNGDFFVEGTKVILVNDEEHHLYVSGIVKPYDIGPDNVVLSSRVADAEIEYTGRGTMSDTQRQGWLARLFNKIWPF